MTDRDKIIETMARGIYINTRSSRQTAEVKARAAYAALQASGMAVVPVEPTLDMVRGGAAKTQDFYTEAGPYPRTKAVWKAMLSASPSFNPVAQEKMDE